MRIIVFAIAVAAGLAILLGSISTSLGGRPDDRTTPPQTLGTGAAGHVIPGRYIVLLRQGIEPAEYADLLGRRHGFAADTVYRHAVTGFAANLSPEAAHSLRGDPAVLLVEPDRTVSAAPRNCRPAWTVSTPTRTPPPA